MHLLLNLQANGRVRHGLGGTTPFHDGKSRSQRSYASGISTIEALTQKVASV